MSGKTKEDAAAPRQLLGWLGWAGADAVGRIALLTAATALFSRALQPRDFGVAALALTFVAVGAVFVGAPFEEALAQRPQLRRLHLRAALGLACAVGVVVLALASGLGFVAARAYGEPELAWMTPAAMTSVFFTGHTAILTALARRERRFNDVARASLAGHFVGLIGAVALIHTGAGAFALVAHRMLISATIDVVLQWRSGQVLLPLWAPRALGGLRRFAMIATLDRLADNLTYFLFANVVTAIYGASVLGLVNMAMRVVEPLRGAVDATSHNLAFSFLAPAARDPRRLGAATRDVITQSSPVSTPLFVGLAAISGTLIPWLAGPGWDGAIGVSACLALGAALAAPPRLVFTAFSAAGRPEFGLTATATSLFVTLAALAALAPLGPISVGLARLAGDGSRLVVAAVSHARVLIWSRRDRLRVFMRAYALSLAMGVAVAAFGRAGLAGPPALRLALMIAAGAALYGALLAVFARPAFDRLARFAKPRWRMA